MVTEAWPRGNLFMLTSQVRRAAVSIPSNMEASQGRNRRPQLRRFLDIDHGSPSERDTRLTLAHRFRIPHEPILHRHLTQAPEVGRLYHGLLRALRATTEASGHHRRPQPTARRHLRTGDWLLIVDVP
ncbi:MAG: hypothetical protein AVDCRST_MAG19-4948 [uncultured Thermomicrobiales bacterium]|uniref:Uncharacterized protein n=1 Tax=uncultured Thermomicrobiales bacterium TaxID=1645740 RepID=A0A6J4VR76_9BACT|nr:MAG: hypothetical protein AVDCRST_MAG19-4948 [uncultured Thermomicrobiales bacterium]